MKKPYFKPPGEKKVKVTGRKPITLQCPNGILITSYNKAEGLYYDAEGNEYTQEQILKPAKKI